MSFLTNIKGQNTLCNEVVEQMNSWNSALDILLHKETLV